MERVTTNLVKVLVMTGVGALLTSTGCATTGGDSSAGMSPARAAQLAEDDCSGIPAKERELGILAYRDAMSASQPLKESEQVGKTKIYRNRGVVFGVRAQPGMTAPWLERIASCHIELAAAGRLATTGATDPLLVPGTTVRVEEAGTGYLISVRVPNDDSASEVTRRMQAFSTGPTGPAMAQGVSP